ncbi:hypothetical protein [Nostoc sp.]|uniref:hypothetical protein n=1 Tax=Nostoc sp. TaxID=1180 RepID=UPI002FFAEC95
MRHASASETDAANKFQLEQQIFDEKAKLAYLENEIDLSKNGKYIQQRHFSDYKGMYDACGGLRLR